MKYAILGKTGEGHFPLFVVDEHGVQGESVTCTSFEECREAAQKVGAELVTEVREGSAVHQAVMLAQAKVAQAKAVASSPPQPGQVAPAAVGSPFPPADPAPAATAAPTAALEPLLGELVYYRYSETVTLPALVTGIPGGQKANLEVLGCDPAQPAKRWPSGVVEGTQVGQWYRPNRRI